MRFEIRKSGGDACDKCGATDLVATPANATLEADLLEAFDNLRWFHLRRKLAHRYLKAEVERVCAELRQATLRA